MVAIAFWHAVQYCMNPVSLTSCEGGRTSFGEQPVELECPCAEVRVLVERRETGAEQQHIAGACRGHRRRERRAQVRVHAGAHGGRHDRVEGLRQRRGGIAEQVGVRDVSATARAKRP